MQDRGLPLQSTVRVRKLRGLDRNTVGNVVTVEPSEGEKGVRAEREPGRGVIDQGQDDRATGVRVRHTPASTAGGGIEPLHELGSSNPREGGETSKGREAPGDEAVLSGRASRGLQAGGTNAVAVVIVDGRLDRLLSYRDQSVRESCEERGEGELHI